MSRAFELGRERYDEQPLDRYGYRHDLKNPQLYPDGFVDGYLNAQEAHQDRYTENRWAEGLTW